LVLPLAVPEFVQGFSWVSITSNVRGYWGAVLVMSCSLYPLVYLPVAAALRRGDPAVERCRSAWDMADGSPSGGSPCP